MTCKPCPVCGRQPAWTPSMAGDKESIECNWESYCPEEGSFDFSTGYLPVEQAITSWNAAVDAHNEKEPTP